MIRGGPGGIPELAVSAREKEMPEAVKDSQLGRNVGPISQTQLKR